MLYTGIVFIVIVLNICDRGRLKGCLCWTGGATENGVGSYPQMHCCLYSRAPKYISLYLKVYPYALPTTDLNSAVLNSTSVLRTVLDMERIWEGAHIRSRAYRKGILA